MSKQDYFVHASGICESANIGRGTTIWAFAHVLPDAVIGEDCNVCDGVFIENKVTIDNYLTQKDIAQIICTSRQTATQLLNEMETKGLLVYNRKQIVILDSTKL